MSDACNLIDLSFDEEINEKENNAAPPENILPQSDDVYPKTPLLHSSYGRDSLDNNPFDQVQKLANRPDDPFDIVEKEACKKALNARLSNVEVKMAKLLSLSDDDILDSKDSPLLNEDNDSGAGNTASTIYHTAADSDLYTVSPPVSIKWTPDTASSGSVPDSGTSEASDSSGGGFTMKSKRKTQPLFKKIISNSTFNSPLSTRRANDTTGSRGCSEDEAHCSPVTKAGNSKSSTSWDEPMLECESPLKLIDDDDLLSEEPPPNALMGSDKDFDAELATLEIPILKQLPPLEPKPKIPEPPKEEVERAEEKAMIAAGNLLDLASLRAKLKAKREENNNQDIAALIKNLKTLICDNDIVDEQKKREADLLLESLSSAFKSEKKSEETKIKDDPAYPPPRPIVRQGTFDIELPKNEGEESHNDGMSIASTVPGENSDITQSTCSAHSGMAMNDAPEGMIKSSATYDGETAADKCDLVLPEVEPLPDPQPLVMQPDVNDLVEQLSRLLEQHNITQQTHSDVSGGSSSSVMNPTFIVVMNTPQMSSAALQKSFCELANSEAEINGNSSMRRRSQSLSIHDKVKIVQFPMPAMATEAACNQDESPPLVTPPSSDRDSYEFKTPARFLRRNSFTHGTPYTPRSSIGSGYGLGPSTTRRASFSLQTHTEGKQSGGGGGDDSDGRTLPSNLPPTQTNLQPFQSGLKRKAKSKTTESILKSSAPLKATMPIKSVAPLVKCSPPTPSSGPLNKTNLNTSLQFLPKATKVSHTSSSMTPSRNTSTAKNASGFPNACSTPTVVRSTPLKRPGVISSIASAASTKTRHLLAPSTPNVKASAGVGSLSSGTSTLRRRTMTSFKAKSPIKTRVSSIGSYAASATSMTSSTARAEAPARAGQPTPNNGMIKPSSATPRLTSRLSLRSKENKKP